MNSKGQNVYHGGATSVIEAMLAAEGLGSSCKYARGIGFLQSEGEWEEGTEGGRQLI